MMHELSTAVRTLARRPGFAVPVVLVLALGVGATTGVFRLAAALLLSEPPVAAPERLAWVIEPVDLDDSLSLPEARDYAERSGAFADAAVYQSLFVDIGGGQAPERVAAEIVDGGYFGLLGVSAASGRLLLPYDDGAPGSGATAVVSSALARRLWGSPERGLGREVVVNRRPFVVVGVAPEGFRGLSFDAAADVWVPLSATTAVVPWFASESEARQRGNRWLRVVGRLADGVAPAAAQERLDAVTRWMAEAYPDTNTLDDERRLFIVADGHPLVRRESLPRLGLVLATAAIILLVSGANAANLLLARAVARRRELGVRRAVGAHRRHLVAHLFTEAALLFAAGGGLGFLASTWLGPLLAPVLPPGVEAAAFAEPDLAVAAFAAAATLTATLLFGLLPALRSTGRRALPVLEHHGATPGRDRQRGQAALVVVQVGLSAVLLVATALLLRTVAASYRVDLGLDTAGVATATLSPARQGWEPERGRAFYAQLDEALAGHSAVAAAALVAPAPLAGSWMRTTVAPEGYQTAPDEDMNVHVTVATPGVFDVLGIRLVAGRGLRPSAAGDAEAVVDRAFARRFWGGEEAALGRRLVVAKDEVLRVVGVVEESHWLSPQRDPEPRFFRTPGGARYEASMAVLARGRGAGIGAGAGGGEPSATAALEAVRAAVARLESEMPLRAAGSLGDAFDRLMAPQRSLAALLALFAGVTLIVAAVGLYGVLAFAVRRRRREIGIRMALGAGEGEVLRSVVGRALVLALAGTAAGLVAAALAGRFIESQLFAVRATDPPSYLAVAAVLALVAAAASLAPAARALRVDPARVLREE